MLAKVASYTKNDVDELTIQIVTSSFNLFQHHTVDLYMKKGGKIYSARKIQAGKKADTTSISQL